MASLHRDDKDAHFRAAFTLISGRSRKQLKRTTATTNRSLATRIALHYEDTSQGRVDVAAAKVFFEKISDLRTRRIVAKVTDELMIQATGRGLGGNTTREFLAAWLKKVKGEIGVRSYDRYAHAFRRFLEILGPRADVGVAEIGVEDIERWRDEMGETGGGGDDQRRPKDSAERFSSGREERSRPAKRGVLGEATDTGCSGPARLHEGRAGAVAGRGEGQDAGFDPLRLLHRGEAAGCLPAAVA